MLALRIALACLPLVACAGRPKIVARGPAPGEGRRVRAVPQTGHGSEITAVAMSADGRVAASGAENVRFWDVATGTLLQTWSWFAVDPGKLSEQYGGDGDTNVFQAIALSPDGRRAVVATKRRLFSVDVASGETLGHYSRRLDWTAVAFAPDGRTVLAAGADGKLELLEFDSWRTAGLLGRHRAGRIVFLDEATVVTFGRRGARAWDWRRARPAPLTAELEARARSTSGVAGGTPQRRIASAGNALQLLDETGAVVHRFRSPLPAADVVALSRDGRRALVGSSATGSVWFWNLDYGIARPRMPVHLPAAISDDGLRIAAVGARRGVDSVEIVDPERGVVEHRLELAGAGKVERLGFLRDASAVVAIRSSPLRVVLWEYGSGRVSERAIPQLPEAVPLALARDARTLAVTSKGALVLVDLPSGRASPAMGTAAKDAPVALFPGSRHVASIAPFRAAAFHMGQQQVERSLSLFDASTGREVREMPVARTAGGAVAFSPDGLRMVAGSSDGRIFEYDLADGSLMRTLRGHSGRILALAYAADGRALVSGSADGSARWWRLEDAASIILLADGDEWVLADDEGRFDGSRGGARLLSAVAGIEPYGVEQLALARNRPDLVLERAGLGDPSVVATFRTRHERRLRRHGLDPAAVEHQLEGAPTAELALGERSGRHVDLVLRASSANADLAGAELSVNGVAVPLDEVRRDGRRLVARQRVELSAGPNRIEATAFDARGVRSLGVSHSLAVERGGPASLLFVGLGVSKYRDSSLDLGYARADVEALAGRLGREKGYGRISVLTFTDAEVSRGALARAREALRATRVDDAVVVLVAGHGAHAADAAGRYYFLPHDVVPARLAETGIELSEIEGLLAGIPARRRLLLMDTCESGELDEAPSASAPPPGVRSRSTRAFRVAEPAGARGARAFLLDRDRLIYDDLERRAGAVVFSSSRGNEVSLELAEARHGAFTKSVLDALAGDAADADGDGTVDLGELRRFVAAAVPRITGELQHPTVDRDNPAVDIRFAVPREAP
jgi:WD40 repeat protein